MAGADDDPMLAVYLERRRDLIRFLAPRAGSMAAAEDLAQDVYFKLAGRDPAIPVDNPKAMLYRVAINVMLDKARGENRAAARDAAWRQITHAQFAGEDVVDEPSADAAAISAERLRKLLEAVSLLPPQMGRAFRLHKLEGHSHAETARQMGLSVKSVEKHISAALKALTARLGP